MEVSQKLKLELTYDPAIVLLNIYIYENTNLKRCMHPNVHSNTIHNSQDMEITQMPINRRLT